MQQSLFISLVITFIIYFNFLSFSLAQDLYDVDEAFFKRNGRIFEVKKDQNQSIREIRKSPPSKGNNKDSPYADEHFNFDTLAGIGLGKRSSPISSFDTLGGIGFGKRSNHFNFDTLGGIGLGKRSSPISRFGQARNAIQHQYGPRLFFRPSKQQLIEKRFLHPSDVDRAIGNRVIAPRYGNKKKPSFPFLWLN